MSFFLPDDASSGLAPHNAANAASLLSGSWLSPATAISVTEKVMAEAFVWQSRPLELVYPVVDGLKGLPQAITTVFPKWMLQMRIVHLLRNSIEYARWKDRKTIKNRGHFPNDAAAIKLQRLAIRIVMQKPERKTFDWGGAMNEFALVRWSAFIEQGGLLIPVNRISSPVLDQSRFFESIRQAPY